mmetsp:Transcript_69547/g.166772  ORF Transcript_69547/g.166772 Transcript_69547/m.166772 type:complete len:921 (-) Transcript_69547:58-2820(-)
MAPVPPLNEVETVCLRPDLCGFLLGAELDREWDGSFIFLSWMVSSVGAFTTLRTVGHMRFCSNRRWYWLLVLMSSIAFGGLAVWNMHQVGMIAMQLIATDIDGNTAKVEIRYRLSLTVLSGLVASMAGGTGILLMASRRKARFADLVGDKRRLARIFFAAGVIATGVCAMHYLGMMSMQGSFEMSWDAGTIVLSFAIAFVVGVVGLVIIWYFPTHTLAHACSGMLIGGAVCSMHYTGMYAATYTLQIDGASSSEENHRMEGDSVVIAGLMANLLMLIVLQHYGEETRVMWQRRVYEDYDRDLQRNITLVFNVADALVNYDLEVAGTLLAARGGTQNSAGSMEPLRLLAPLKLLLRNLQVYRAFLPHALFDKSTAFQAEIPNTTLKESLQTAEGEPEQLEEAVLRLRDPDYTLAEFHEHMTKAFPELTLYLSGNHTTSGHTGTEEYQRTLGALYTFFAFIRLDIDGKYLMSYGVDSKGVPLHEPAADDKAAEKKTRFFEKMDWYGLIELMLRAGILERDIGARGHHAIVPERTIGMLALTAIHDIMKNGCLLPTVQEGHAPYHSHTEGDTITDHDLALAYILENYPGLLPSFQRLTPAQRAPVLFTQAKMNFNNGWLVQGEAPPGALFKEFKAAINQGRASESDVSFYFVHWITDLAGAEAYGERPWPGAEKFTLKLPPHVLMSFLNSFSFVEQLAESSEVQVMEDYLQHRFRTLKLQMPAQLGPEFFIASARLALMAQGFEQHVLAALELLVDDDKETLAAELSRTGCREQFTNAPPQVANRTLGPAILIYYAPALLQNAGMHEAQGALIILAAVFRAARVIFPLDSHSFDQTVTVRIDAMKAVKPGDIMRRQPWMLKRTSAISAEVLSSEVASFPAATPSIAGSVSHSGAGSATRDGPEAGLVMVELPYLLHRTPSFEV